MNSEDAQKFFKEVPNKAGAPVPTVTHKPASYEEAVNAIESIIKNKDHDLYKRYVSGKIYNNKVNTGTDVLHLIVKCYIDVVRADIASNVTNSEEAQKCNIAAANYKVALDSIIEMSKDLNFNVDVNSVIATIQGSLTYKLKEHINDD